MVAVFATVGVAGFSDCFVAGVFSGRAVEGAFAAGVVVIAAASSPLLHERVRSAIIATTILKAQMPK